jgi:hypothetical protein
MNISEILQEALKDNNKQLNEVLSESKYIDPIRVKVVIKKTEGEDNYPTARDKFDQISKFTIHPEVLVDYSDGTGEICFPGRKDIENWVEQVIDEIVSDEESKYFDIEIY